jgi:hypothetical protein
VAENVPSGTAWRFAARQFVSPGGTRETNL